MMGNDRYTSPETSRLLAEAGLESTPGPHWHEDVQGTSGWSLHKHDGFSCIQPRLRALDLTDLLHELIRPRPEEKDARPLVDMIRDPWRLSAGPNGCWRFSLSFPNRWDYTSSEGTEMLRADGQEDSPVEAAALVLLALLRERKS